MVGVQGWRLQSRPGESNGAMVRGSARNSVVGRAERLRSMSGGSGCSQEASNVEPWALGQSVIWAAQSGRRTSRRADEQGVQEKGAGERGAIWSSPVLECQNAKLHLVASHDVARLLAGM